MEENKYLTEQERVDNMTMKIDNDNLLGSGFIKHPPQERKPQRNFNDDYGNRNSRYDGFNRRGGGGRSRFPQRRNFGPRSHHVPYRPPYKPPYNDMNGGRPPYNDMNGGRPPFRPHRGGPYRGQHPLQRSHFNPRHQGPPPHFRGGHYGGEMHYQNRRPPHFDNYEQQQQFSNSSWRVPNYQRNGHWRNAPPMDERSSFPNSSNGETNGGMYEDDVKAV